MGLDASTCSECLPVVACDFEPPEHVQRTSRPGPTLAPWCSGGLLACPGAERMRKKPRPEEKDMPIYKKTHLYIIIDTIKRRGG